MCQTVLGVEFAVALCDGVKLGRDEEEEQKQEEGSTDADGRDGGVVGRGEHESLTLLTDETRNPAGPNGGFLPEVPRLRLRRAGQGTTHQCVRAEVPVDAAQTR